MRLKLIAAFGSALLVLVVVWVAIAAIDRTEDARRGVDHAWNVRRIVNAMRMRLADARLALATYIASGDASVIAPARNVRVAVLGLFDTAAALTVDNPEQQRRMATARPLLERAIATVEAGAAAIDAGDRAGEALRSWATAERSSFADVEQLLDAVREDEEHLIHQRTLMADERAVTSRVMLVAGGGLSFLLLVFVIVRIRVSVHEVEKANHIIEAQTRELTLRSAQLEASLKELDQFAYVASHDLRAPLRAIANLASWIEEDAKDRLDDDGKEHLRLMVSRVMRMEALVEGVLAYSRAGRTPQVEESIAVAALLRDVIDLLQPPEGTSVVVETPMPTVRAARVPFQQVWLNLISNAVKHGKRPGAVRVGVTRADGEPAFYVADDGPGIDPQFHQRIFGLFQTLEARDRVESTGIGLAVVKKLVEQQGGRVWLASAVGQGATFYFTFPPRPVVSKAMPFAGSAAPTQDRAPDAERRSDA
ncbi:MAG: ATP-binding protein [Myxococcota bacterium]